MHDVIYVLELYSKIWILPVFELLVFWRKSWCGIIFFNISLEKKFNICLYLEVMLAYSQVEGNCYFGKMDSLCSLPQSC